MSNIFFVAGIAIVGLTALGCMALSKGINGKVLTTITGAITGVVGFCLGQTV